MIIHISTFDNKGGSGKSAYRIHNGLKSKGIISNIYCKYKVSNDNDVITISNWIIDFIDHVLYKLQSIFSLNDLIYFSTLLIKFNKKFKSSQIIQLYNLHGNYFGLLLLPFISRNKIVILRLSDMWPMTGHCGYSFDCGKWINGCGSCPRLSEYPSITRDTTKILWKIKLFVFSRIKNLHIVAPSRWIKSISESSQFFINSEKHYIPNGIDLNIYIPRDKEYIRKILNLPIDQKIILFISESITNDYRKGYNYFFEALNIINDQYEIKPVILLVGNFDENSSNFRIPFQVFKAGFLNSEYDLNMYYSAADILVLPTLAENLPNTILESMASGTPVVGFKTGGLLDAVIHLENGYLAKHGDSSDLAFGINNILSDQELYNACRNNAIRQIVQNFSLDLEISRFVELYKSIFNVKGC
jgi:glycosyltransferase involved in cell wall biosynthesis